MENGEINDVGLKHKKWGVENGVKGGKCGKI